MRDSLEDQLSDDLTDEQLRRRRVDVPDDGLVGGEGPNDNNDPQTPVPLPTPPNFGRMSDYEADKWNDPNHKTGKYQIGRALSAFDPKLGITPEVLTALNALGYGSFSGSGQRLSLKGLTDAGRAAKIEQDFSDQDWIKSFAGGTNPNAKWQDAWGLPETASPNTGSTTAGILAALQARNRTSASAPTGNLTGDHVGTSVAPTPSPTRTNFKWGVAGQGVEGVDWGNTNNWTEQQWIDYENRYGIPHPAAAPTPAADPNAPDTSLEGMLKKLLEDEAAKKGERDAFNQKIHGSIIEGINENSKPVDDNDAIIQQQMRARRGEADRSLSAGREAMAARAATSGMPTGAFDASLQSSYENVGTEMGAAHAGLLADRYKDKLTQLMQLRSLGAGVMSADEQASLNAQITAIKARLDQEQIRSSSQISNRDIDMRGNIASMQDALERARLDQNDNHFYDTLGFNIGDREAMYNEMIMRQLTGG